MDKEKRTLFRAKTDIGAAMDGILEASDALCFVSKYTIEHPIDLHVIQSLLECKCRLDDIYDDLGYMLNKINEFLNTHIPQAIIKI